MWVSLDLAMAPCGIRHRKFMRVSCVPNGGRRYRSSLSKESE